MYYTPDLRFFRSIRRNEEILNRLKSRYHLSIIKKQLIYKRFFFYSFSHFVFLITIVTRHWCTITDSSNISSKKKNSQSRKCFISPDPRSDSWFSGICYGVWWNVLIRLLLRRWRRRRFCQRGYLRELFYRGGQVILPSQTCPNKRVNWVKSWLKRVYHVDQPPRL